VDRIVIRGAREHNLKNIDLELPRDSLVVISGLSGSGKSSLAFDTIFAEGQRRYVESLSSYARQFLGRLDKPDVDAIEGLSPAIAIEQKTTHRNPRSTVGTVTEIYDYLRVLFARVGVPHCPMTALRSRQSACAITAPCSPGRRRRGSVPAPICASEQFRSVTTCGRGSFGCGWTAPPTI
jgi:excinuclease ABC subunit A